MRPTIFFAACATLVCASLAALGSQPENAKPTYAVEITLKNRATKKEAYALKATVTAGQAEKITSISQRPFVTGVSGTTAFSPTIQVIDFGAVAHMKISETDSDALDVDATIEVSEITEVRAKAYPGKQTNVQTVRVATAQTRLLETIAPNEKLTSTISIAGQTYDASLSVIRKNTK